MLVLVDGCSFEEGFQIRWLAGFGSHFSHLLEEFIVLELWQNFRHHILG